MSEVYVLEPATDGKVVLETTMGAIEIELWTRQCPKACRNFLQLCKNNYYNGCLFHRLMKGFLVQTGDPTNSGEGGESIFESGFGVESHGRLRFRYRGLVGMACRGEDLEHGNASQFFFTLDRCDALNRKSTLFGKVVGETLWNLLKIGELEVDENDRPIDPPAIIKAEVLWDPFDLQQTRDFAAERLAQSAPDIAADEEDSSQQQRDQRFNLVMHKKKQLLSFNEADSEEDEDVLPPSARIRPVSSFAVPGDEPAEPEGEETALAALKRRVRAAAEAAKKSDALADKALTQEHALEQDAHAGAQAERAQAERSEGERSDGERSRPEEPESAQEFSAPATKAALDMEYKPGRLPIKKRGLGSSVRHDQDIALLLEQEDVVAASTAAGKLARLKGKSSSASRKNQAAEQALAQFQTRLRAKAQGSEWLSNALRFPTDSSTAYEREEQRQQQQQQKKQ